MDDWMNEVGGWTYSTYQDFMWGEGGPLAKELVSPWNLFANMPTITLYVFQIHVLPPPPSTNF